MPLDPSACALHRWLLQRLALMISLVSLGFVAGLTLAPEVVAALAPAPGALQGAGPQLGDSEPPEAAAAPDVVLPPDATPEALDASLEAVFRPPPTGASPAAPPEPLAVVTRGDLARGDTLAGSLRKQGIASEVIHVIAREMRSVFDFRHAQPGDRYRLAQDANGRILEFRYVQGPERRFRLERAGDEGFDARREEVELTPRVARIAGVVTSSLYVAIRDLGEDPQLARDFADLFAWDVDFGRGVQPGDDFRILYERLYRFDEDGSDHYVRPGRILAARYRGLAGEFSAVYFEGQSGEGAYYRADGSSVRRAFLAAPLRYSRISSSYSQARRHPILKVTRPHHGIDYAAPRGSEVWAVADGTVIYRGWGGGFGNLVKVRHTNGLVSYYGHLSRFEPGLRVGRKVEQKQVIGYVGATGLATGPHVCFRIAKDGHYVNPLELESPAGPPVPSDHWASFRTRRDLLLSELDGSATIATEEAL